jgi:hypothetical protein
MVAPAIIAGLGALGGVIVGAILGRPKSTYGVIWITRVGVEGQIFQNLEAARVFQDRLSRGGRASMLVEKSAGSYRDLRVLRAVTQGGKSISPEKLRAMPASYLHPTQAYTGPQMAVGSRDFDTNEEALEVTQATTRLPTPEWAKRANKGPYPETNPGRQVTMPEAPLFDDTTSSHMWETEVDTWQVPGKYFPSGKSYKQPDELVVTQALQYPMDDNADGGLTQSDRHPSGKKAEAGDPYDPFYADEGKDE